MGQSRDNEPGFSFAKLIGTNNYKKWAREIKYSLKCAELWDHTVLAIENRKPVAIVLQGKDLKNDTKLKQQEKRKDKIFAQTK